MTNLSLARRTIFFVAYIPLLVCSVNWLGGYHWFWPNEKAVQGAAVALFLLALNLVGPTRKELEEEQEKSERESEEYARRLDREMETE